MPDINVGQLAEAINDKMDRDCNNIESPRLPIFLVAKQDPSADNNYTWYRKWSDGFVEQGGTATSNGGQVISISLPIEMANANYWGFATLEQATTANVCGQKYTSTYSTTTTFVTFLQGGSGKWFVCGMAAN